MQKKYNQKLPNKIKNWNFLPLALRSLKPYDDQIKKLKCCKKLTNNKSNAENEKSNQNDESLEMK